ncbi:DHHA1 domain-containing protein [Aeoliella sp. ICT_H6.2]|uniref:DHHA1 domain-containing protein n=1 Tax=Aeoliella straminimaris TaxID=2954799 RepID=A0A9X2FCR2_9BACT|nr:DHH family phosphoesterase [Aeoliella straminimaris]MCO6045667.1 DHHA1 domain-containing protein [Aeoliella straminimaris]
MAIAWRPFVDLVSENQSFVLTTHQRPDCDALGSEIAMAAALESLGKTVRIVNADGVPPHIAFMDPHNRVEVLGEGVLPSAILAADIDVIMVLDTSAWQQLATMGDVLRESSAKKVVIDHHVGGDDLGAEVFKDDSAEANGRLVLEAIEALGVSLNEEMARVLFAAIATDTGWFRFASVGAVTYAAVEKLVAAGASPATIFGHLYEQNTLARVLLHGHILQDIVVEPGGHLAHAAATLEDFAETGADPSDSEDIVNRLLTIAGVEVAALFVALEGQLTKVSLRSRGDADVRAVAEVFGGGGHRAAAGLRVAESVEKTRELVVAELRNKMGGS